MMSSMIDMLSVDVVSFRFSRGHGGAVKRGEVRRVGMGRKDEMVPATGLFTRDLARSKSKPNEGAKGYLLSIEKTLTTGYRTIKGKPKRGSKRV